MLYVWGSPELYDAWGKTVGKEWDYKRVARALKENETYLGKTEGKRGERGPVDVIQDRVPRNRLNKTFVRAVEKTTGVPLVEDYNAGYDENVAYYGQYAQKQNCKTRVRESSATAYIGPEVISQGNEVFPDGVGSNILLLSKCTVNKVLFKNKTASKVLFTRNGITEIAKARKEIVLCAGAMTPTILQRSGIGDKCYLQSLGIKSILNNPHVGAHLKTHNAISFAVEVATPLIKNKDGIFGQAFLRMGHWHRRIRS